MKWYEHWKNARYKWHLSLGVDPEKYRFHDHEKLAHYANAAADIEYNSHLVLKKSREFILEQILI